MSLQAAEERVPTTAGVLRKGDFIEQYELSDDGGVCGDFRLYRVHHCSLDTERLLKVLLRKGAEEEFLHGEQALAAAQARSIRRVFEAGFDDTRNFAYAVLEECAPETLGDFRRFGRFSPSDAMTVLHTAAEALCAWEAARLHHGDISASSFVFTPDYRLLKLDFRESSVLSISGTSLDDDLRGVGVVLFELLIGRKPPENEGDPRKFDTSIPVSLAEVIARLLSPIRSKRFRSAEELLASVNLIRGEIVPTPPAELRRLDEQAVPRRGRGGFLAGSLRSFSWIDWLCAAFGALLLLTLVCRGVSWFRAIPPPTPVPVSAEAGELRRELDRLEAEQSRLREYLEALRNYENTEMSR